MCVGVRGRRGPRQGTRCWRLQRAVHAARGTRRMGSNAHRWGCHGRAACGAGDAAGGNVGQVAGGRPQVRVSRPQATWRIAVAPCTADCVGVRVGRVQRTRGAVWAGGRWCVRSAWRVSPCSCHGSACVERVASPGQQQAKRGAVPATPRGSAWREERAAKTCRRHGGGWHERGRCGRRSTGCLPEQPAWTRGTPSPSAGQHWRWRWPLRTSTREASRAASSRWPCGVTRSRKSGSVRARGPGPWRHAQ